MALFNIFVMFLLYAAAFGVAYWLIDRKLPADPPFIRLVGFVLWGLALIFVLILAAQGGLPGSGALLR